jgi:hypothetical protein
VAPQGSTVELSAYQQPGAVVLAVTAIQQDSKQASRLCHALHPCSSQQALRSRRLAQASLLLAAGYVSRTTAELPARHAEGKLWFASVGCSAGPVVRFLQLNHRAPGIGAAAEQVDTSLRRMYVRYVAVLDVQPTALSNHCEVNDCTLS